MKVIVLGGGVIGVASAYYLSRSGHEVTVVDRQPEPGRETSFANGGQISWSSANPWAAPGIPLTAFKWLFKRHSPLVVRPRFDPALWRWLVQMLRNCTIERFDLNKERIVRLARYSHECLVELRRETNIAYDSGTRGTLILYRTQQALDAAMKDNIVLQGLGIAYKSVDRAECVAHEPGLGPVANKFVGGIYYPGDESGDCEKFTCALMQLAAQNGARFLPSHTIKRFSVAQHRIEGVVTHQGTIAGDAYVVACGSYSPLLLRALGIYFPVYPVKGYSLTLPVTNDSDAPRGTLTDDLYKVVVTRLGDRIRIAGTAELAGYDLKLRSARCATLDHVLHDLFPNVGGRAQAEYWCGLRPMTPDNVPILGATPYKNLFLNTGHGTLGWTMACGSGKLLADILSGKKTGISTDGLTLSRFGN